MSGGAEIRRLEDGRLHFHHGPIDIIAEAHGDSGAVKAAYERAALRFQHVLSELVGELDLLRTPVAGIARVPAGPIARRMLRAASCHGGVFVTPMAAVAGAVADDLLAHMVDGGGLKRAYVNNGGDIAVHLAPGERLVAGVVENADRPARDATVTLSFDAPVRGLATSGWRGRSLSFGIADAVTVLARTAAEADVAATLIANAVDADHAAIVKRPADEVRDDTDLGRHLVTVDVGRLPRPVIASALRRGVDVARRMRLNGLIAASYLALQGHVEVDGRQLNPIGKAL